MGFPPTGGKRETKRSGPVFVKEKAAFLSWHSVQCGEYWTANMTTEISAWPTRQRAAVGFTLVEMLVVIGVIGILMAMLLPVLGRAKAKAHQTTCLNHIRQLTLAAGMYANDHEEEFPARRSPTNAWPEKLKTYYLDWKILTCPSDRFGLKNEPIPRRSFLVNGFNDFFLQTLKPTEYMAFQRHLWPHGMRPAAIPKPSETLLFGEKISGSRHIHMDLDQGRRGNDFDQIEHQRHGRGSNFAFADGSAKFILKYKELYPENLWAVINEYRYPPAPPQGLP